MRTSCRTIPGFCVRSSVFLFQAFVMIGCSHAVEPTPSAPAVATVPHSIIATNTVPGSKRSLEIRLEKEATEDELRALALVLKKADTNSYERTFIGYYLPGMKVDAGYWASTHFNPNLEVRILGISADQQKEIDAYSSSRAVRVTVSNDTKNNPLRDDAELVLRGQGEPWLLKVATRFGGDVRTPVKRKIGEKDFVLLYLNGRNGPNISIPFKMTTEMNPDGSPRDAINITITDTSVEAIGMPIRAATGKPDMKFARPAGR